MRLDPESSDLSKYEKFKDVETNRFTHFRFNYYISEANRHRFDLVPNRLWLIKNFYKFQSKSERSYIWMAGTAKTSVAYKIYIICT